MNIFSAKTIYNLASLSWIYFEPPYARRERCSAAKVFQVVSFQKNFLRQQLVFKWNHMCYCFQFDDPDMVKGFRYKLYSTATEADQLKKEEKVKFPLSCPTTLGRWIICTKMLKIPKKHGLVFLNI